MRAGIVHLLQRQRLVSAVLVALLIVALPHLAAAQGTGTATVRGTVSDSSGGVLPGVSITITNSNTKESRTATTGGRGTWL